MVLVAAGFWLGGHVQPANELAAYKQFLRAKGEKLELAEVLPPPVPAESNSAAALEEAFGMYGSGSEKSPYAMVIVAPGKALIGWKQPEALGWNFTNSWDEFATNVAVDEQAIELLHQVLDRPRLDFQHNYIGDLSTVANYYMPLGRSARKLTAAAVLELHDGDSGAATTNILTLLTLIHHDASEGLVLWFRLRVGMASCAVEPTWEILQATNVTDAQLATVQDGWQQLDFLSDAENAYLLERAWAAAHIQKLRDSPAECKKALARRDNPGGWDCPDIIADHTRGLRLAIGETLWRSSWSYSEELQLVKADQMILEALRTSRTNHNQFLKADYDSLTSRLSSLGLTNAGAAFYDLLGIPHLRDGYVKPGESSLPYTLRLQAARNVAIAAIAIKRYQLRHGQWPATLAELTPEFLAAVPIDPCDGKPLKYRPNTDGTFLLYSVGEDGVDDGGDPTNTTISDGGSDSFDWQDPTARDWVWPQPATPAEVQNFYEHPPR